MTAGPIEIDRPALRRVGDRPRLYVADGFATDAEITHLLARGHAAESDASIATTRNSTGFAFEMVIPGDAVAERLAADIHKTLKMGTDPLDTFRFRRYSVGEAHPPHLDNYRMGDRFLLVTAIVYLEGAEQGGETRFDRSTPASVSIRPVRGRLAAWFSHRPDGRVEELSMHEGMAVERGIKTTATAFIYRPLSFAARVIDAQPFEREETAPILV